jgi:hypothetical protein
MAANRENAISDEMVDELLAGRDPATYSRAVVWWMN